MEGGEQEVDNLSDDILSDTGWDTDLEIESMHPWDVNACNITIHTALD